MKEDSILSYVFIFIFCLIAIYNSYFAVFKTKKFVLNIAKRYERKSNKRKRILSQYNFCLMKIVGVCIFVFSSFLFIYTLIMVMHQIW